MTKIDELCVKTKKSLDADRESKPRLYEVLMDWTMSLPIVTDKSIYVFDSDSNQYRRHSAYSDGKVSSYVWGDLTFVKQMNRRLADAL